VVHPYNIKNYIIFNTYRVAIRNKKNEEGMLDEWVMNTKSCMEKKIVGYRMAHSVAANTATLCGWPPATKSS
jgi:hypothetical protein